MFRKKHALFYYDEEIDMASPMRGVLLFDFIGTPKELEQEILSLKRYATNDLFSNAVKVVTRKVPLVQIIWSEHPHYQKIWPEKGGHEFLNDMDGQKTAWLPRKGMGDSFIALKKHPDNDEYCIGSDGNKRVLKSLIRNESWPDYVYAKVEFREWKKVTHSVLSYIRSSNLYQIQMRICRSRHYRKSPQLFLGLREYSDSRLFYILLDWNELLDIPQALHRPENKNRMMIASWEHHTWIDRAMVYLKQLF